MQQATLRIVDDGPYARATRGGDVTVSLWCNDHCDLLHVTGASDARADAVVDSVAETVGVRDDRREGDTRVVVTDACLRDHRPATIDAVLADHGCLLLAPLTYRDGAKHCRVLAIDGASLTALYRDLVADHDVDVVQKHDRPGTPANAPDAPLADRLPRLTDRQRDVLHAAHDAGYYRIPRDTTTQALADDFDLDRRTVEDHLRRAENKILDALVEGGLV